MLRARFSITSTLANLSRLANLCAISLAAVLLCAMTLFVTIQVIARYGFSSPPQWTEEAARYCMVWLGLLGASVSFHKGLDPVVISLDGFPEHKRAIARLSNAIAAILFSGVILYASIGFLARHSLRASDALGINMAIVVSVVPLFALLILLHALAIALIAIGSLRPQKDL